MESYPVNNSKWVDILNLEYLLDPENTIKAIELIADCYEKHPGTIDKTE